MQSQPRAPRLEHVDFPPGQLAFVWNATRGGRLPTTDRVLTEEERAYPHCVCSLFCCCCF